MEQYLIDSNIVIDYLGNLLSPKGSIFLSELTPVISIISKIEILGWYKASSAQVNKLLPFINNSIIYPLDELTTIQTIKLRQQFKIKIPDAIIAATALAHKLTLLTRNQKDFLGITDLKIINPYAL